MTLLKDLGQDGNIAKYFQHYANDKLTPLFSEDFSEVTFSLERGDEKGSGNLKISKGEESSFIWSVFYALLDQAIAMLNVAEVGERETDEFDHLEYVFIDDPVSSLDENHLIELAVNLAGLIKSSGSELKFLITTHSPLFYNVLYNELKGKTCYLLQRLEDGTFSLTEKQGDSNKSFSYHLHLKQTLEQAIAKNQIERYHFTLLRNLYEKTASFLGFPKWSELLPEPKRAYLSRIIQFTSHSTLSNEAVAEPTVPEKQIVKQLLEHLIREFHFWQQGEDDVAESHPAKGPANVPLSARTQVQGLKTPEAILLLLQENPRLSRQEIAMVLEKHLRTIGRAIVKLQKAGRLRRIGSDKAGHWEVQG